MTERAARRPAAGALDWRRAAVTEPVVPALEEAPVTVQAVAQPQEVAALVRAGTSAAEAAEWAGPVPSPRPRQPYPRSIGTPSPTPANGPRKCIPPYYHGTGAAGAQLQKQATAIMKPCNVYTPPDYDPRKSTR